MTFVRALNEIVTYVSVGKLPPARRLKLGHC